MTLGAEEGAGNSSPLREEKEINALWQAGRLATACGRLPVACCSCTLHVTVGYAL